jgi:hypothetical protein
MATKKDKMEEVSAVAPAVTVTTETPAQADTTSNPIPNDAKANEPPVRTNRPDVPIAQVLGAGAGAHEPEDDPHVGADGRFYADADEAKATYVGLAGADVEPAK